MSRNQKIRVKGKQVLLLGLVALVITAGYYRWTIETEKLETVPVTADTLPVNGEQDDGQENPTGEESVGSKNMNQLRQERESSRSEALEQWKKIVESKDASQSAKTDAEKKIKQSNTWAEKEKTIETLVKTKGYSDCFAHISESGISVVVAGGEINGAKVAQIKDIIVSETEIPVRDIKISAETF